MFAAVVLLSLVLQAAQPPPPATSPADKPVASDASPLSKLKAVKRIYVDSFGDEAVAKQIQAMVITSLAEMKRFVVTENKEKADAILRGTALEKTSQEASSFSEGAAAASGLGLAAAEDKHSSTETVHEARVAVRLVSSDGDVIWTTTQESRGAKYKGASADVADKVAKQLMRDLEKAERPRSSQGQ
jgi:altronate dehydratase